MKIKITLFVIFILVLSNLSAFDGSIFNPFNGKRKGIIFGLGGGIVNISSEQDVLDGTEKESDIGYALEFNIGYAPSHKLEIYYWEH